MKRSGFRETIVSPAIGLLFLIISCGKSDSPDPGPQPGACDNVNITVTTEATNSSACLSNGKITVTASGSTNLQYSINGTSFQASNVFENLAKGSYTVTVKNSNNCSKTAAVTVNEGSSTPGPLFTAAKSVISTICVNCHAPNGQQPTPNFTVDCNIVAFAARIKVRAVDEGTMPAAPTPPLTQDEKDKLAAWVNAGGRITD